MTRGRAGFTLIELSVAMIIGAMVVAGAHQAVVTASEARARAESARAGVARSAGARDLLTNWLRGAVPRPRGAPFVEDREEAWDSESVVFQVADGGALFPGPRTVRLWIARGAAGGAGLMAAVSRRPGEPGPADTLLLEPEAERLTMRYWGAVDGADRWVETWPTPDVLPRVVELRVAGTPRVRIGPGGTRTEDVSPLLRLPLRVPLALGAW